ncbi:MAG: uncharacterized protein H6Q52_862 [Deltaproteobacteria bacterium]|nr:uncharacterized protein [Deltaproteobacteria bacterium]
MDIPYKPFTIIAVGSFAPVPEGPQRAKIIPVDTPNEALSILRPAVWIPVAKEMCPAGGVGITPERMKDFSPQGMVESVEYLKDLGDARELINRSAELRPDNIAEAIRERWPDLPLDLSVNQPKVNTQERNRVDDILSMVALGGQSHSQNSGNREGLKAWTAEIDKLLGGVLGAVFSDDTFNDLEASWRGIELITKQGPAGGAKDTRLSIVNTSRDNLAQALRELREVCESDPPDLVLIDFPFDNSPVSMGFFEEMASFAQELIVPTVVNASAGFLGLHSWDQIDRLPLLAHYVDDNPIYAKWARLRKDPCANWLAAACNNFCVREAYGKGPDSRGVLFEEQSVLWIHPVFAIGTLAAQSVSLSGWPSRLVDSQNVRLEGLALHSLENETRASTETVFTVDRLRQLADIGITPLAGAAMKDIAFLPSARAISGESLPFQMFFSRITGFLIRLREETGASIPIDAGAWLAAALQAFFRLSGNHIPEDLSVTAPADKGRPVLEISLTPPATILSGTRRITFTFAW